MNNPDSIDRLNNYLPPDRIKRLQQSDKDKRQKFSKVLEEKQKEEEHQDSGQRQEDQVEIGDEYTVPTGPEAEEEPKPDETRPEETEEDAETTKLKKAKHIDLKV